MATLAGPGGRAIAGSRSFDHGAYWLGWSVDMWSVNGLVILARSVMFPSNGALVVCSAAARSPVSSMVSV